ncbi:MAG: amidohydrolase [Dehalococcoidales bacterium]|nr:MAG: amidohydrolase [Dehalococcoidales bacterium]
MKVTPILCYNLAMVIDFHTHIFPPWIKNDRSKYAGSDHTLASMYSSPKAKMATADEVVASMDQDGVDISVVLNIGWSSNELYTATNDYIMESITCYPKRLIGFCTVPLQSPDTAIAEIERCVKGGIKGIGEIRPDPQRTDLINGEAIRSVIELIIKHKLVLLTHTSEPVGHIYPGKGKITPDVIYPLITAFPELKLVCAHWGGGLPFYALMPEVKGALANVFFDTAASPFLYNPQIYRQVSEILGADKILFGTDYPLMPQRRVIKEIKSLNLPGETEEMILAGNAQRLLGIDNGTER